MKATLTLIFLIIFGAIALAHNNTSHENKTAPRKMGILLDTGTVRTFTIEEVAIDKTKKVARLYRYKNSRVIKALNFTTKRNKAKLV